MDSDKVLVMDAGTIVVSVWFNRSFIDSMNWNPFISELQL